MASLQDRVDAVVAEHHGVVDVRRLIAQVVCEQVCHALFGDPYEAWSKPVSAALDVASGALHTLSSSFLPAAHILAVGQASRLRQLRRTLVAFATQVVADVQSKRGTAQAPPFASAHLDALSPAEQVDEVVTQLVAGTESTSLTCSWLLLLLAQHPAVLAAVRRDLADVEVPLETLPLTSEHALVRSLRETLRLYPSFWQFLRVARRASTIVDDTDAADVRRVDVVPGTIAFIVPYLAHRDARVFADPERFDPWRHDASRALSPELLTFGYGPRSCIGARLAVQIATTTTAAFLRGRDFVFVDDHTDTRPLVFGLNRRGGFLATPRAL
jgi:cytochrome P450